MTDLKRWADLYGLPFGQVPKGNNIHRINKGLFFAEDRNQARDYVREAYDALWGKGGDPNSDELLSTLASKLGWNSDEFLTFVGSPQADARYEEVFSKAEAAGVFGVPIVVIDGQMWWGNDRLDFVDAYLSANS
jgi:2-hydroxychromene-2-carboxylate isomerase